MGVRGLKSFLERENQTFSVKLAEEVNKWKRDHPNQKPTIVIDFLSLVYGVAKKNDDTIFGGRHKIALESWKKFMDALKASGCSLVFFADLILQEHKKEEWFSRHNQMCEFYESIYHLIDIGETVDKIIAAVKDEEGLTTTFYGMEVISEAYGDFHYAVHHECDLELAQYATRNNAMAVISNDTDFLIFEGSWRFWSSNDLQITASNEIKLVEYNRNGLAEVCSLSQQQLPLFATLVGNDLTSYEQMIGFHRSLGPMKYKFQNIARFVRGFGNENLSNSSIQRISWHVFGSDNDEHQKLIRKSLESYNLDFPPPTIDDPLEEMLAMTNMYRPYASTKCLIQFFTMSFYDMHNYDSTTSFPMLLEQWLKRKIGVLRNKYKDDAFIFTLLAKKDINRPYQEYKETPIYPDSKYCLLIPIPALDELYSGTDDTYTIEIKWKILSWIMSLNDSVIDKMKKLPTKYLLISSILYPLVQNKLIAIEEADGILYTEEKLYNNETTNAKYLTALVAKYVRAAHLYNITYSHVRHCFAIAGLLYKADGVLQFDGVYYQKLMEKVGRMNLSERDLFFAPIKNYRLYAQDN